MTDSADNQTVSAPFAVYARGSANGANVSDTAKLTAGFPAKVYRRSKAGKRYYTYVLRPSRTVSYGKGGTLRGILRNADGQPITGADVRILVRENRTGAQYVDRGGLTTGADGRVSLGYPGGLLAHVSADLQGLRRRRQPRRALEGDAQHARSHHRARAPRHIRSRGTARFRGTLVGRPRPRRRCDARAPGLPAAAGAGGLSGRRARARAAATRVRYKFNSRQRQLPVPHAPAPERRVSVRTGRQVAVCACASAECSRRGANLAPGAPTTGI